MAAVFKNGTVRLAVFSLTFLCSRTPAGAFDHSHRAWNIALDGYAKNGLVDYSGLKNNPDKLNNYLRALAAVSEQEYASWPRTAKIAFWINAYNALAIKAVVDHYPVKPVFPSYFRHSGDSIQHVFGVWDRLKFKVKGETVSLDRIEHDILREELHEPRAHFALASATKSGPPLRPRAYLGADLDAQLEDQAARFLKDSANYRIDRARSRVFLSPIFKWYGDEFVKPYGTEEAFAGRDEARRAILNFISRRVGEGDRRYLRTASYSIKYVAYDWSLNEYKTRPARD